jgi:allantoin racemase
MVSVAYLVSSRGHGEDELARREQIANDLVAADVSMVPVDDGPQSVESTVEEEWAAAGLLRLIERHEDEFDAFFVGCFGEPGLAAARELADAPVVGSASATFHTAAQVADRFSCLTILDATAPMARRQVHEMGLADRLASVRVVEAPVLDIDHGSEKLAERMTAVGRAAVEEDGAEALVPGCMSLAFARIHERIAADLSVPFLDPVTIGLETAALWARQGITQSPAAYPSPNRAKLSALFD